MYLVCSKLVGIVIFVKTLLRHGANPDLRDEDGKTPMDKARERNDEGHREVVHILQSPGIHVVAICFSYLLYTFFLKCPIRFYRAE